MRKETKKNFSLSDFKGKNVILYFYPKDENPWMYSRGLRFRDNFDRISAKAVVIGVSADSIESHKKIPKKSCFKVHFAYLIQNIKYSKNLVFGVRKKCMAMCF